MKKTLLICVSIVFACIVVLSGIIFYVKARTAIKLEENKSLISKIESVVKTSSSIDFKTITDFQWDKLYIITPYGQPENTLKENNIKWINIDKSIEVSDGINLIIFTYKGDIVSYVNYPRNLGDFYPLKFKEFDKNKATFNINKTNNEIKLTPAD